MLTNNSVLLNIQMIADHAADVRPKGMPYARSFLGLSAHVHYERIQLGSALSD